MKLLRSIPAPTAALLVAGLIYLGYLLSLPAAAVFYSGDGGLKYLLTRQYAQGDLSPALTLPVQPPAGSGLWKDGLYPYQPPFVYHVGSERVVSFPLYFPLVSTPFYKAIGWRGLYVLPALALTFFWLSIALLWGSDRTHAWSHFAALLSIVFASPLTVYGAMFWEHTPAVFLASFAVVPMMWRLRKAPDESRERPFDLAMGIVSGLAVFFRPEAAIVVVCAVGLYLWAFRKDRSAQLLHFAGGFSLSVAAFAVANRIIYGHFLGLHAEQVVRRSLVSLPYLAAAVHRTGFLFYYLGWTWPFLLFLIVAAPFVLVGPFRWKREFVVSSLVIVLSVPLIALVVPNTGGKEWGPRYLLVVLPWCAVATALAVEALVRHGRVWQRATVFVVFAYCLVVGARVDTWEGSGALARDYEARVLPTLKLVEAQPQRVVVVSDGWIPLELAKLTDTKVFVWPRTESATDTLRSRLREAGMGSVLVVSPRGAPPPKLGTLRTIGAAGAYVVRAATVGG